MVVAAAFLHHAQRQMTMWSDVQPFARRLLMDCIVIVGGTNSSISTRTNSFAIVALHQLRVRVFNTTNAPIRWGRFGERRVGQSEPPAAPQHRSQGSESQDARHWEDTTRVITVCNTGPLFWLILTTTTDRYP
jgi:hypothetical protein